MKRLMMWVVLPVLAVVLIGSMTPVHAIPAFEAEYKKTYYKQMEALNKRNWLLRLTRSAKPKTARLLAATSAISLAKAKR